MSGSVRTWQQKLIRKPGGESCRVFCLYEVGPAVRPSLSKYGTTADRGPARRYCPGVCIGADREVIAGNPDEKMTSTSQVERMNLSMRMGMRRFKRVPVLDRASAQSGGSLRCRRLGLGQSASGKPVKAQWIGLRGLPPVKSGHLANAPPTAKFRLDSAVTMFLYCSHERRARPMTNLQPVLTMPR